MNETLRTVDGRAVLTIERRLAHPPEKVWRALTEPAHLSQWYPFTATEVEVRAGGKIVFDDGQGGAMAGRVTEADPPRVFAFTQDPGELYPAEGETMLRFDLRPDGGGCVLVFTHTFHDRPHAAANAAGWQVCLDALEQVVGGQPVEVADRFAELHEVYVELFGLDQGSTEATADGWRLRFDRQLMRQPVEKVWAALTASGVQVPAVGDAPPAAFTTGAVQPGTVTAIQAPTLLEYDWRAGGRPAGRVRWELSASPAGARVTLIQTGLTRTGLAEGGAGGPAGAQPAAAAEAAWRSHIGRLVERIRRADG